MTSFILATNTSELFVYIDISTGQFKHIWNIPPIYSREKKIIGYIDTSTGKIDGIEEDCAFHHIFDTHKRHTASVITMSQKYNPNIQVIYADNYYGDKKIAQLLIKALGFKRLFIKSKQCIIV